MEYDLDHKFLNDLLIQQKGLCAISGMKMEINSDPNRKTSAPSFNVLSIDRKDSTKGYTKDNIQLVINCINMLKSYHEDYEINEVIKHLVEKYK